MIASYEKNMNRKVRVFISSTFSDMGKERDIIVNSVFPRLRKEFDAQMVDILEVDLRWGVPEDVSENNKILEICIGEVLHCSPFFIGIVGERYGSLASKDAIEKLPPYYRKTLGEDIPEGTSITELEMRAGALCKEDRNFSAFYIRKSEKEQVDTQVENLCERIYESCEYYTYDSLAKFEEDIFEKLKTYILRVIPEKAAVPYGDKNYFSHLKILKTNVASYVADNLFVAQVERELEKSRFVYIRGGKGSGKSALTSWMIKKYGMEQGENVFFHYVAAGNQSFRMESIYQRLRLYLKNLTGGEILESDDRAAVAEHMKKLTDDQKVFLFVDAVEQLDDVTAIYKLKDLADVSEQIYVLCSGTEQYAEISGTQEILMNELNQDQIRLILKGTLNKYGKKLSARMKKQIVESKNCKNPLFLKVLIAQLRAYGSYDTLENYFEQLMSKNTFEEIFCMVIERIKFYFEDRNISKEKVNEVLALMVYSYNGVSENEINKVVSLLPVARSVLLSAIELFTIEENGLLRFNHDLIIDIVKKILDETDINYEQWVSDKLLAYFANTDGGWRKYTEESFQLCKKDEKDSLFQVLSDADCFKYLLENEYTVLTGYLSFLNCAQNQLLLELSDNLSEEEIVAASELFCKAGCNYAAISLAERVIAKADSKKRIELLQIIAKAQYNTTKNHFEDAIATYKILLEEYKFVYPNDIFGYASRKYRLGCTYATAGRMKEANQIFEECAEIILRNKIDTALSIDALSAYGASCYALGNLDKAIMVLETVIRNCIKNYGRFSHELSRAYCYGWSTLYALGDKSRAFEMVWKSHDICKKIFLEHGPAYAWAAMNAGTAALVDQDITEAEKLYKKSIEENNAMLAEAERPHVYALTTYSNLAVLYAYNNDLEKARNIIAFTVDESIKKNGEYHVHTANFWMVSGIINKDSLHIRKALEIYENQTEYTPDYYYARIMLSIVLVSEGEAECAETEIKDTYEAYCVENRRTDFLDYLFLNAIEKIAGNLSEDEMDMMDDLYRFDDYRFYMSHSNNSCVMLILEV